MPTDGPGQPIGSLTLTVSEFVGLLNQTLEFAYPWVTIVGELSGFRISKNRWVYFELKDESASVKCFGTVYMLPGPLEDGLMVQVSGTPRLHPAYGFSVNLQSIQPVGEGSLKRAADLLKAKLQAEGLFRPERKRLLPHPPRTIGLITSGQSAAYADFIKILSHRWAGVEVLLADVQVQGEAAPAQLTRAIEYFNNQAILPDALVVTRGGGSAEDLAAFNSESVTRAVAASRVPTLVAIGHEVDISLAELAADARASTPSNAAELLTPDKARELQQLGQQLTSLAAHLHHIVEANHQDILQISVKLTELLHNKIAQISQKLSVQKQLLSALAPQTILDRGYAIIRAGNQVIRSGHQLSTGQSVTVELSDASATATVEDVRLQ